jgi:hypothetical protein
MQAFANGSLNANIVAAFENQADAERAVSELRQAGYRREQLGYFVWHPIKGFKNLLDQDYAAECALVGTILGTVFGVWMAPLVNDHFVSVRTVLGFFELTVLSAIGFALLFAFIGWEIGTRLHESRAEAPEVDAEAGPFILTVSPGEYSDWVWAVLRRHHGYEPQPAHAPHSHAI